MKYDLVKSEEDCCVDFRNIHGRTIRGHSGELGASPVDGDSMFNSSTASGRISGDRFVHPRNHSLMWASFCYEPSTRQAGSLRV